MPTKLFPFPLVEGNVEGLRARHSRSGSAIYLTVVLSLLVAAAALPLVTVEVSSRARGILRPTTRLTPVTIPTEGRVTLARLTENRPVCAGDTLLRISTAELTNERRHLTTQLEERHRLLADLERLLGARPRVPGKSDNGDYPRLTTAVYQRDYREYRRQRDALALRTTHATRELERQQSLLATGSVAAMEVDRLSHERELLLSESRQLTDRRRQGWTQERQRIRREAADLRRQLDRLGQRENDYVVTAPVDGHLTQTAALAEGSHARGGTTLARISPDDGLRVEAFVDPADIGLLRVGQSVNLQLDAFHHHQWGMASATLTEIATDVTQTDDGAAAFRIVCELHDPELSLKNGYVGRLRKGMTLTAHFQLTERTLFQLLRDDVDDWLNPKSI